MQLPTRSIAGSLQALANRVLPSKGQARGAKRRVPGTWRSRTFDEVKLVDISGRSVRVGIRRANGSAPPLLVFNGIGASLELLEPFVEALKGVEVVTFDVPGVGGSPSPTVPYRYSEVARLADRLLITLGYEGPIDVLGYSWGGMAAQQYAYENPGRCRRLILAGTSAGSVMWPGRPSAVTKLTSPRRHHDSEHYSNAAPEIYGGSVGDEPRLIDQHVRRALPPQRLGYLYQLAALWGWTSVPWLHRIRQPTLIMAGTDDPIMPPANAHMLARLIRRSELFTIDDGHLFLITRAREVAPVVKRFLAASSIKGSGWTWLTRIGARLRGRGQAVRS